jgi:hypothetical protein
MLLAATSENEPSAGEDHENRDNTSHRLGCKQDLCAVGTDECDWIAAKELTRNDLCLTRIGRIDEMRPRRIAQRVRVVLGNR